MTVGVAELVGGALGGAIVTSVITPLLAQRIDRRQHRASALSALGLVEQNRWGDKDFQAFREAVRKLRTTALVAGADRTLVDRYLLYAQVARQTSDWNVESADGYPEAAGIPTSLANLVPATAEALVDHLWHPWRTRIFRAHTVRQLDRAVDRIKRADEERNMVPIIDWAVTPIR